MNPADNPAEVERARETTDTNEKDTDMKENDTPKKNLDKELKNLNAAHITGNKYRILSKGGDSLTHYVVNIEDGTCECEAAEYAEDAESCKHLAKALMVHTSHHSPEEWAARDIQTLTERARNLLWDLRDATDFAKTLAENNARTYEGDPGVPASEKHDGAYKDDSAVSEQPEGTGGIDTIAKMGELQSAFDDVVEDMRTEESGNLIWIQTGKDTPETIPGPGNVQVFDAFLKNPSQVEFIHDDHPRASDRPGQWWKNAIKPSQVDSYINEVLQ